MAKTKTKSVRVAGEPKGKLLVQQNGAPRFPRLFKKRGIKTLMKHDPAIDKRAQGLLNDQNGVVTGDRGGMKGGVRVVHQHPIVPPAPNANTKTIKTPRLGRLKKQ